MCIVHIHNILAAVYILPFSFISGSKLKKGLSRCGDAVSHAAVSSSGDVTPTSASANDDGQPGTSAEVSGMENHLAQVHAALIIRFEFSLFFSVFSCVASFC